MRLTFIIFLLIMASSCQPKPKINIEQEKANLMASAQGYQDAGKTMDVNKILSYYTDDARVLPPGEASVAGMPALKTYMDGFKSLTNFQASFEVPLIHLDSNGEMGYSLSNGALSWENEEGKLQEEKIRDLHIWVKVNGQWRISIDTWNALPPLKTPTQ